MAPGRALEGSGVKMRAEVSKRSYEEAIECALLQNGPDACSRWPPSVREAGLAYGEVLLGG
jgi:hypothetical protein